MIEPISRSVSSPNQSQGSIQSPVLNDVQQTTLQSIQKQGSSYSILEYPLKVISTVWKWFSYLSSMILNGIQRVFGFSKEESPFWQRAKKEFETIYRDTHLLESSPNLKSYTGNVKKLSDDIKEGYKTHLLKAHAQVVCKKLSAEEQAQWIKDQQNTFNFEPYFTMTQNNTVIVKGVKSYWEEIQSHLV